MDGINAIRLAGTGESTDRRLENIEALKQQHFLEFATHAMVGRHRR